MSSEPPQSPSPAPSPPPSPSPYTSPSMIPNVPESIAGGSLTYTKPGSSDSVDATTSYGRLSTATQPRDSIASTTADAENPGQNEPPSGWKSLPGKLVLAIVAAGIGTAFQHGYNTGVTNVPTKLILEFINETSRQRNPAAEVTNEAINVIFSTIVSVFAIGGMFGALATGYVSDKIGRKAGLVYNNILVFIAAGLMGFAKSCSSYEMLLAGRFVIGINSGLNAGLGPMYLSEISPVHFRGAIGTIYQLIITISILASNILGSDSFLGTEKLWPVLLAATLFGSLVMLALLPMCPESPNFLLIIKENDTQAQKGEYLRGLLHRIAWFIHLFPARIIFLSWPT